MLFADLKARWSCSRTATREARQLLDPVLQRMMDAVHRYEGTVNQVMGDGIMALFGAPLAHEDHAVRACYAALAMQAAMRALHRGGAPRPRHRAADACGSQRGEVVVRAIGNDLHMDYSAVGQTTHLAARMEQLATPGSIRLTAGPCGWRKGSSRSRAWGRCRSRGWRSRSRCSSWSGPAGPRRLQAGGAGAHPLRGAAAELAALRQALARPEAGHGQVVAMVGRGRGGEVAPGLRVCPFPSNPGLAGAGERLGILWQGHAVFPCRGPAQALCPRRGARDEPRTIRAKVTGQVLTLDRALQETIPALLALLDALPDDSPSHPRSTPAPPAHARGLKRAATARKSGAAAAAGVEDLHWMDAETQALLDSLVESLPRPGSCCWSITAPSTSTAGAARRTTRNCGSTRCRPRAPTRSCRRSWGTIPAWRRSRSS